MKRARFPRVQRFLGRLYAHPWFDWTLRGIVYRLRLQEWRIRIRAWQADRQLQRLVHREDLAIMKDLLAQWRSERQVDRADRD
ncbi:MAG: hypothetical protein KDC71_10520 [Acidobacteria bacterium]|nr:hypothetical protein [Acidobacteriota bacterium]